MPSSSVSSAATTRSVTPESKLCPRRGASASISSRNTSDGAESRARRNSSRTAFSDEPTHLSISSAPLTACTLQPARAGQRPHHERLAAAGRAVEQHAARRVDAEALEGLGMLQRPQHRLGERLLGLDHVADVVERHRPDRHLFGGRPRQRADDAERTGQILLRQRRRLAVLAGPRRRPQRRLAHQRGQIGDHETRCAFGDFVEIEVLRRERRAAAPRAAACGPRRRAG